MAEKRVVRRQERADTSTNWTTLNPVLAEGEWGVDSTLDRAKLGDGVTAWNDLAWYAGGGGGSVSWAEVTGKPATFPPAPHTHPISQVDNLQAALDTLAARGIPVGGTTGQVLAKTSNTDGAVGWVNQSGGGGAVSSVNAKTGAVVLNAADVGAATTAQGAKADSAVQPGSLAAVATSGSYADLSDKPTIPSVSVTSVNAKTGVVVLNASDVGAATTAQGVKADSAVQASDLATVAETGSYNDLVDLPTTGDTALNLTDTGYDIFLLIGQSNMAGDSGGAIDTDIDVTDARVYTFDSTGAKADKIRLGSDPLGQFSTDNIIVGPGMSFGRWMAHCRAGNRRVLLVPAAQNGTGMLTGSPRWDVSAGQLYPDAVAQALAARTAAGANARFAGALWCQGETDAIAGISGASYRAALLNLIQSLRTALGTPELPFVIGSMAPEFMSSYVAPTKVDIDAAHKAIPGLLTFTSFVQGPSGMGRGDNLHYAPAGNREQGRRMVGGYATALANGTPTAPAQVTGLSADGGNAQVVLTWSAPSNGGSAITDYSVQYRTSAGPGAWTDVAHSASTATTRTVTGLTNGTLYDFRVAALNGVGTGPYSGTASATPATATAPAQVTGLAATPGDTKVTLSWTTPATGGSAITTYSVQYRLTGAGSWSTFAHSASTATTIDVTGLTNASGYDFQVAAVNAIGTGTYSASQSATPVAAGPTVADTYTRANSATSLGTTEVGALLYELINGGPYGVNTNQAYSASEDDNSLVVINTGTTDGTFEAQVVVRDAGTALVWRLQDASNWYCILVSPTLTQMCKTVAGSLSVVGSTLTSANGDTWKVEVLGTQHKLYRNGTLVATITDAALTTGTKWGYRADTSAGRFDLLKFWAP